MYTLEIPSDALLVATKVGLTPVASLSGMPVGGAQTYSIQFSPEGLSLQNFATLTITPVVEIPLAEQLTFGYLGAGQDLILAAPVVDSREIKIHVLHFSGNGVTKGLLADIEPVRERLGGSAERRIQSAVSAALIRQRNQGDSGEIGDIFAEAFRQYEEQVIKPRVAAAGESCAAGRLALQTVIGYERQRQLIGLGEDGGMFDRFPGLMDKVTRVCVIEEFELCVEQHVIHRMVTVWIGFARQYQLLGLDGGAVSREARDLTVKCLTFKLKFKSTARSKLYKSSVTSEIILRFDPDSVTISGAAPLVNETFEFFANGCEITNIPGGGTFNVFRLIYLEAADGGLGKVRDLDVNYYPGQTSESATVKCPGTGPLSVPAFPAWTSLFGGNHLAEASGTGFTATGWEILAGELYATKEWDLSFKGVDEKGSFELHHTPGA